MSMILITGASGYIGSHTALCFLEAGHEIVCIDNHVNSTGEALNRVAALSERQFPNYVMDVRDFAAVQTVLKEHQVNAIVHFAGLKAVGESVDEPLKYFDVNVNGSLQLIRAAQAAHVSQFIFSSSATVYSPAQSSPLDEHGALGPNNPYGLSKLQVEEILKATCLSANNFKGISLRYFNPVGAHPSGKLGESPLGIPTNLVPYIAQVAVGRQPHLNIFGNDYPTSDGTGIRDYLHVVDLARAHLLAYQSLLTDKPTPSYQVMNLGTGQGYSVFEILNAYEQACAQKIPFKIAPRRPGDQATCYADPSLAQKSIGWKAELDLKQMMLDAWHFQKQNPQGY